MEYRTLGDTGLLVSTLYFGCMTIHLGSPTRIAPGWLLDQPVVTTVIMGAKRMDQLQTT
jgi:aryl-alcohol dehydrogenase-like predicted oxidoreductase